MLGRADIEALIQLRIPEAEAKAVLLQLTPDRIDGPLLQRFIDVMKAESLPFPTLPEAVMDCCGTGGSGLSHFNTSTTTAFVLASAGVPVVKFGNRAMTSRSGSFDFLEGLGIPVTFPLERVPDVLGESNLAFVFAPQCYPTLARFNTLRRSLGVKTIFNFIGPLLNPVEPAYKLMGVSDAHMLLQVGEYLSSHPPIRRALVAMGENGLDEILYGGLTRLLHVAPGQVVEEPLEIVSEPDTVFPVEPLSVEANVLIFKALVNGDDTDSVFQRMVCLNAGAGLMVAGKAGSVEEGSLMVSELLRSGTVASTVEKCRRAYERVTA